jgi:hypothetical protein
MACRSLYGSCSFTHNCWPLSHAWQVILVLPQVTEVVVDEQGPVELKQLSRHRW